MSSLAGGGYASVNGLIPGNNNDPSGNIWSWSANVSFVDLGKEGAQLSFAGGMIPRFRSSQGATEIAAGVQQDPDTSYLLEGLYKFPINDNIAITPGAYVVFNPNHVSTNENVYVGVIRTTFTF